jgi:hypothetical protein
MFTIRVIEKDTGLPAKGVVVSVALSGFLGSTMTRDEFTDQEGEATFDYNPGQGIVYVSRGGFSGSQKAWEGEVKGMRTVYID